MEQLPDQRSFGESMSEMFKGGSSSVVNAAVDKGAQRTSLDEDKLLVLQGQITKLKKELRDQQNEIKDFTDDLEKGKRALERQLKEQMEVFKKNAEKALDAERFSQITQGLHVSTTIEEKFEEVTATYTAQKEVTLLHQISKDLLLVNGPDNSIDILSTKTLEVIHNLDTDGQMAFCACQINDMLFVGCNKGNVFVYNATQGYAKIHHVTLKDRVTAMKTLTLEDGTKHLICCQFTGHVHILSVQGGKVPEPVSYVHHNTLSNIFCIEPIPTNEDKKFKFALATNNGVITLQIIKKDLKQSLSGEKYCDGNVVNNLLVHGNHLIAFIHDADGYMIINRDDKKATELKWPMNKKSVVIGAAMTPNFHRDENSFVFVRDESTIKLINTQDWKVCDLVQIGEALKYPDLNLFEVMNEGAN